MTLTNGASVTAATARPSDPDISSASYADIATVVSAVVFVLIGLAIRRLKNVIKPHFIGAMITDLLQGAAFFPFLLLAVSIFSREALEALLASNRAILALSGIIAALYVVSDFVKAALSSESTHQHAGQRSLENG